MPATLKVAHTRGIPAGTTIKAFAQKGFVTQVPDSGLPSGTELGSAAVASDGSWELAGASEGVQYILAAETSAGKWRYLVVTADTAGLRGANARMGTTTLVAGKATVANPTVTAESRIYLTGEGAITNAGSLTVKAKTAGTGFEIESTNGSDVRAVSYLILDP